MCTRTHAHTHTNTCTNDAHAHMHIYTQKRSCCIPTPDGKQAINPLRPYTVDFLGVRWWDGRRQSAHARKIDPIKLCVVVVGRGRMEQARSNALAVSRGGAQGGCMTLTCARYSGCMALHVTWVWGGSALWAGAPSAQCPSMHVHAPQQHVHVAQCKKVGSTSCCGLCSTGHDACPCC